MPKTGEADYAGLATVSADQAIYSYWLPLSGVVDLHANFGDGTITGNITKNTDGETLTTIGDISLTAGTIVGNGFSGAATGKPTAGAKYDISGAKGVFHGNFFGPSAVEAGGTFNLSDKGMKTFIAGSFGTRQVSH